MVRRLIASSNLDEERVCENLSGLYVGVRLALMRIRAVSPNNGDGFESRFFNQASETPVDCSVIFVIARFVIARKLRVRESSSPRGGKVGKRGAFSTFPRLF